MRRVDAWLEATIGATRTLNKPILVLCRSNASVHAVRAWAASTGLPGFEIATPAGLARQLDGPWLDGRGAGDDAVPDTPFTARLASRPGLVALTRQRVRELRLFRAADPAVRAPAWLNTLADSDWWTDTHLQERLLRLARQGGSRLTKSLEWSRIVSIGFDVPLDPWEKAVHDALTGASAPAGPPRVAPKTALGVPDTTSEARLAAHHAALDPENTLVLVQHEATAARIHRALIRNGIASAYRPPARLERHTLASVVRRAVAWFSGSADPAIRATDLHFVLRHPMVDRRLPPPALAWLKEQLRDRGEDPEYTQLSPRAVAKIIERARHLDAPLSRWLAELEALSYRTDLGGTPSRALRLLARLKVLHACITGQSFREVFDSDAHEEEADWGDFDALVASLLGDQDPNALPDMPPAGTLGALRRFLLACRLRTRDDPASLRILGALRRGSGRPATRLNALELLHGTVDRGEVRPGVAIVTYDDYDGRPSNTLILVDVHDQGVASRPSPDPLLTEDQLEDLGILHGRARVRFRLDQLERAVGATQDVVTIVTARDAMGRAVVAPVQLGLHITPAETGAYGLECPVPEIDRLGALSVVAATAEAPTGPHAHRAVQMTAEWWRHGRGPSHDSATPPIGGRPTLAHLLATRPTPPDWLTPWLGHAEGVPEASLPDAEHSVSRLFRPLSHCLYQAFARNVLRIDPQDTVAEELDAREVGNAVHLVLEATARRGAWSTTGDLQSVREAFEDDLLRATDTSFETAREAFGTLSPARLAATKGLEARWSAHWKDYVRHRTTRGVPGIVMRRAAENLLFDHRVLDLATLALAESGRLAELTPASDYTLKQWIKSTAISASDADDPAGRPDAILAAPDDRTRLPTAWAPVLREFLKHPRFHRVVDLWRLACHLSTAIRAPIHAAVAELPFGDREEIATVGDLQDGSPTRIGPITLDLGRESVRVQGFVDRITLVGDPSAPLLRIADYKTGRNAPDERSGRRQLMELIEPQLVLYALAVRAAIAAGTLDGPFAGGTIATLGWDHLRATGPDRKLLAARDDYLVDDATLTLLGRALGSLVHHGRQGRWTLSPRKDTCPALSGWSHDHCPFVGACRLREVPS